MVDTNIGIDSILKPILLERGSSFGKYLSRMDYVDNANGRQAEFYITPISTRTLKKVLVITKIIEDNWYDSVKELRGIIGFLNKQYNLGPKEYKMILHAYFRSIDFEQFYNIRFDTAELIEKITITEFEKILN